MKRFFTLALAVIMLIGCFPVSAQAAESSSSVGMAPIGANGYQTMTTSQEFIDVLKASEGYSPTPVGDYKQYSVGFGCYANQPDGYVSYVTIAQAEALLKKVLKRDVEPVVNAYCKKIGRQPNQGQFDCLVSLTYNCSSKWMNGYRIDKWLRNPTTADEFVDALGNWMRAGGQILYPLVQRRIRDAVMFLYGEYSMPAYFSNYNIQSDIPVITYDNIPYYCSVIYRCNGGTLPDGKSDGVSFHSKGEAYTHLTVPTRAGYTFAGWKVTKVNNKSKNATGEILYLDTTVTKNVEVTAQWVRGTNVAVENQDRICGQLTVTETPDVVAPSVPALPSEPLVEGLPFLDIKPADWFVEDLKYVYDEGYMKGTSDTMFEPENKMTRGMLVTILYRLSGEPEVTDEDRQAFIDIAGEYYTDAVAWAKANGIVYGITEDEFQPEAKLTRQQAVAIFYRYCVEYSKADASGEDDLASFTDADELDEYSVEATRWAVANGVISGVSSHEGVHLDPDGALTRCQAAAILKRCATQIVELG